MMVTYLDQQKDKKCLQALSPLSLSPLFFSRAKLTSSTTSIPAMLLTLIVFLFLPSVCNSFTYNVGVSVLVPTGARTTIQKAKHENIGGGSLSSASIITTTSYIMVSMLHNLREPDMMEIMAGGQRYELVPLPDSMLDTTIFVGNLCEFAQDEDLSRTFQSVSILQSVPACVARRPNSQSLKYGFVTFPTVGEKETAILRFHGTKFMGRRLRVEEIDDRRKGRIRVPERMVSYVLGDAKKTPRRKKNDLSLRRISPVPQKRGDDENNRNNDSHQSRPKRDRKREARRQLRRKGRRSNYDEDFFMS